MLALVIGGGIGGLTTAVALRSAGLAVEVFEQANELREIGAGMGITPNAVLLLNRLGMEKGLEEIGVVPELRRIRRWDDGRILHQVTDEEYRKRYGLPAYAVYRRNLLDLLAEQLPKNVIHLGHRCIAIEQRADRVEVTFEDGAVAEGDCVVGADGIHSVVRELVHGPRTARYSGLVAFRGVVPVEELPLIAAENAHDIFWGPGRIAHSYLASQKYWAFVGDAPAKHAGIESWTPTATRADFRTEFLGWHPQVLQVIDAAETIGKFAMFDRDPLPSWSVGRVTLMGDAAHSMLHFLGQGANQAIEDAVVLAGCLRQTASSGVPSALERYESLRKPRTTRIQLANRDLLNVVLLADGEQQRARDEEMAASSTVAAQDWLLMYDAERALD